MYHSAIRYLILVTSTLLQLQNGLLHAQQDLVSVDTLPDKWVGVELVSGPLATGVEFSFTKVQEYSGDQLSLLIAGFDQKVRGLCAQFTDSTRTAFQLGESSQFDRQRSSYEVFVRRHNLFNLRYVKFKLTKNKEFAWRSLVGYRLTRWHVRTIHEPYFPQSLFDNCGSEGWDFIPVKENYQATNIVFGAASETRPYVHTFEVGGGLQYYLSYKDSLQFTFKMNAFLLIHVNKASLKVESPLPNIDINRSIVTEGGPALGFDVGLGLSWRL